MSHYAGYVEDEYEMEGVDDDSDDEFRGREMGGSDSDVDEYDYLNSKAPDTTAAQARKGKDIQGIPWDRLSITREKYRQTRLEQYKNYENIPNSGEGSGKHHLRGYQSPRSNQLDPCRSQRHYEVTNPLGAINWVHADPYIILGVTNPLGAINWIHVDSNITLGVTNPLRAVNWIHADPNITLRLLIILRRSIGSMSIPISPWGLPIPWGQLIGSMPIPTSP
ncbi:hypothetical protein GBA52_021606 [Prunus armeniaca]|nr:hypothetical protein GBA52_021606 [Prunus armeniaca]